MYDYQTLTLTNTDGSISPFANGASGLILLGTGTSTPPAWTSLADAGIATLTDLAGYLPLTGGTLTGALTGTTATFTGLTISGLGSGVVKASSGALSVGNVALGSEVTGTLPVGNGGTGTTSLTGIVVGNGSSAFSTVSTTSASAGDVLKYTGSGYAFASIGTLLPPITGLACATSGTTIANDMFLRAGANVTDNPTWEHITASNIYGASNSYPSVLISAGGATSGTSTGNWLPTSALTTTPQILAALSGSSNGLRFYSPAELGLAALSGATFSGAVTLNNGLTLGTTSGSTVTLMTGILKADNGVVSPISATSNDEGNFLQYNGSGSYSWVDIGDITGAYLPLAGGAMYGGGIGTTASVLSSWIEENAGIYTGLNHASALTSTTFLLKTKIGITGTSLGDYCIRIHGYSADNSSDTVDYLIYLSNTTSGSAGQFMQTVRGWRNHGSLTPTTFRAYAQDANNKNTWNNQQQSCLSIYFAFSSSKTLILAVDFISHDLSRSAIVNSTATGYQLINGWSVVNTSPSGSYVDLLSTSPSYLITEVAQEAAKVSHALTISHINSDYTTTTKTFDGTQAQTVTEQAYAKGILYCASAGNMMAYSVAPASGSSNVFLRWTGSAYEFASLPAIPTAPTDLPLTDTETGSLGTSGTYATADHQHPLPYAVQAAYKFYYPRKLGIGGAITAEAQEYDGTADLILQVTEIDPAAIINTVPIEKGGTGASTASAALTNLGAAASNHNHDGTYLKLSGGSSQAMTGALYFNSALSTAIVAPGMSEGVVTVGSGGAFSSTSNVNSYVTGRRNNINLYDADVSDDASAPTSINHTAKNDTTVNIVCGSSATRAYTRYINLPTPTADMLGDTITIYFTNQKPAVTGNLWATCSTDERIMDYRYEHFKNAETTGWKNCSWANGNVVQFTCIKLESTGTTYYWRAVKLVEQSW